MKNKLTGQTRLMAPKRHGALTRSGFSLREPVRVRRVALTSSQVNKSVKYIRARIKNFTPEVGIVLGTGLGDFSNEINNKIIVPYNKIPNFPVSTVMTHKGELVFGKINNKPVVVMSGRFHYYEGYSLQEITFPIRVMKALGIKVLIISAAAGSVNIDCPCGMVVLIKDHINLLGNSPLIGPNDDSLGPRFPDMYSAYDKSLLELAGEVCRKNNIKTHEAIYACLAGPNLETPAEYRMLRILGADVVGMSTVPEVIVGVHSGLRILALAVVTDLATPETIKPVDINEIISVANNAGPHLSAIIKGVIAQL